MRVLEQQRLGAQRGGERRAEALDSGDGERAEREPVIAAAIGSETMLSGDEHRRFERGFDRFRSGAREKRPFQLRRKHLRQAIEEADAQLGWVHVTHPVQQQARLARDGVDDAGIAMAEVGDAERRGTVDVAIAVGVGDDRARRTLPEHGKVVAQERDVA